MESTSTKTPRILIVAGGTGGHLYPGIAVAQALWRATVPDGWHRPQIHFVVRRGDLGREILQREGFDVIEISGQGLPRRVSASFMKFPATFFSSCQESLALLETEKPNFVLGMGGYLSFPVLGAAAWKHIPTLIHEQNAVPGLANRLLARWVDSVAVSFLGSETFFPTSKVWLAGLPVRLTLQHAHTEAAQATFGLRKNVPTFLAFGGSLGAHHLNEVFLQVWEKLLAAGRSFQVIHVSGTHDFPEFERRFKERKIPGHAMAYCHDMPSAYAAADLVLSRSGASTIAELATIGRPAILIPYPYATNDHQWFNAQVLVKKGMAEAMRESALTVEGLTDRLSHLLESTELTDWKKRCDMGKMAHGSGSPSVTLAQHILNHAAV